MIHARMTQCECGRECVIGLPGCARCLDAGILPWEYAEMSSADGLQLEGEQPRGGEPGETMSPVYLEE